MFRFFFLLTLLTSSFTYAESRRLFCEASYNTESIFETEVILSKGERNKLYGNLGGIAFYVSDLGNNKVELHVFNSYEPSRSYASSDFSRPNSRVELVVWKQDYLLETRCRN